MAIYTHVKWPSFENIHRLLNHKCIPEDILVTVTEKIDGCNFGIEIHNGRVVSFNGRNHNLWTIKSSETPTSFNKNNLGFIWKEESKYVELYKTLGIEDPQTLILFGELYQSKLFPFGYAVRDLSNPDSIRYHTMTTHLWKLFNSLDLNPPKLFFGKDLMLTEAISGLHDIMMNPPPEFEGVFITCGSDPTRPRGMKYKTGKYEEQKGWYVEDEYLPEVFENTAKLILEVFKTKEPDIPVKAPKTVYKYTHDIKLAFNSVNSKYGFTGDTFKKMDSETKRSTLETLNREIYDDILSQGLTEVDQDSLKNEIKRIVPKFLISV